MTRRRSCRAFDRGSTVVEISTPSGRWRYVSRQTSQKKTVRGVRTLIRVTGPGTELWELAGTRDPELGPRIEDPRRSQLKISISPPLPHRLTLEAWSLQRAATSRDLRLTRPPNHCASFLAQRFRAAYSRGPRYSRQAQPQQPAPTPAIVMRNPEEHAEFFPS